MGASVSAGLLGVRVNGGSHFEASTRVGFSTAWDVFCLLVLVQARRVGSGVSSFFLLVSLGWDILFWKIRVSFSPTSLLWLYGLVWLPAIRDSLT